MMTINQMELLDFIGDMAIAKYDSRTTGKNEAHPLLP